MYFMQHLLFPGHLVSAEDSSIDGSRTTAKCADDLPSPVKDRALQLPQELLDLLFLNSTLPSISTSSGFPTGFPVDKLPADFQTCEALSAGLHQTLQVLDPPIAAKWHWKDIRKIRRSLEIILQTGRLYSDIIAEQKEDTMPAP